MTDQLRQILSANCKAARESGDPKRIADADQAMDDALAECQAHTADRVKRIEARVEKMDATLDRMNTQMTDYVATSAQLAEKHNETKQALEAVKGELAGIKLVLTPKDPPAPPQSKAHWVVQLMSNQGFQFFILLLFLIGAFCYLTTGKGGVEAAKDTVKTVVTGGAK